MKARRVNSSNWKQSSAREGRSGGGCWVLGLAVPGVGESPHSPGPRATEASFCRLKPAQRTTVALSCSPLEALSPTCPSGVMAGVRSLRTFPTQTPDDLKALGEKNFRLFAAHTKKRTRKQKTRCWNDCSKILGYFCSCLRNAGCDRRLAFGLRVSETQDP